MSLTARHASRSRRLTDIERVIDDYLRAIDPRLPQREPAEFAELEARFIAVAQTYAAARGISRAAWREAGVTFSVLDRAGLRQ